MTNPTLTRRRVLVSGTTGVATAALAPAATAASAAAPDGFQYEVTRTEDEWKSMLSADEYDILRNGGTEWPLSSPLATDYREGSFACKGCGLELYRSEWRVPLDKGWVFFTHSQPNAVLTDIDKAANYAMQPGAERTLIEVHCRRCGSHLGHILVVDRKLVHCVNGASLVFTPSTA